MTKVIRATPPASDKWFVVRHRTGPLDAILNTMLAEMDREGYEHYRPKFACMARVGTRMEMVSRPLFRDYMFIRPVGFNANRKPFLSIHGVDGGFRAAVTNEVVAALRAQEVADLLHFVESNDPVRDLIKAGDTVELNDGEKFLGLWVQAVVSDKTPDGRLSLLFDLVNGSARFTVSLASVVKVRDGDEGRPVKGPKTGKGGKAKAAGVWDAARKWADAADAK